MQGRIHPAVLIDALGVGRVGVVPARPFLHQRALVRGVAIDLVGTHEDERCLGTETAHGLQQVQCADGVHVEVLEGAIPGELVRGLCGAVDEKSGPGGVHQRVHGLAIADVEIVMGEAPSVLPQPGEIPRRVAVGTEEHAAHVVVHPMDLPPSRIEEGHRFGADEPAAPGDDDALHRGAPSIVRRA